MKSRDYTSFSSAAKSRFRRVADELGYEQLTGTVYAKPGAGWLETFNLQAAGHGNDFFYVNYGIVVPDLCPVSDSTPIVDCGMLLSERLRDIDETGGFDRTDKAAIERSADRVLIQYKKYARSWFDALSSWDAIAAEYLRINPIKESLIGRHSTTFGEDFRSATYGYLLLKGNRTADALRWLGEAERLMSMPTYFTRDGRTVHAKEKFARLQKLEPYAVEALQHVRQTMEFVAGPSLGEPEHLPSPLA